MQPDVVRFACVIQEDDRSLEREDSFIAEYLPLLKDAAGSDLLWHYFSRHYKPEQSLPDTVWFVCKAAAGCIGQLEQTGRSVLDQAVKAAKIVSYEPELLTDEKALGRDSKEVAGLDDVLPYELFWRFADAASRAALRVILKRVPGTTSDRICVAWQRQAGKRVDIAQRWAHFFWNALGVDDVVVPLVMNRQ